VAGEVLAMPRLVMSAKQKVIGIEMRFSSPIASLRGTVADRHVTQTRIEYLLILNEGSKKVLPNAPRESKVFNTAGFTRAINDSLSEFARRVENGTWHEPDQTAA
jgi:hypothetical protein